jgi:hypothetical protein
MTTAAELLAGGLASMWLAAGIGKLLAFNSTLGSRVEWDVNRGVRPSMLKFMSLIEVTLAIATLIAPGPVALWLSASGVLLVAMAGYVALRVRRESGLSCDCFGPLAASLRFSAGHVIALTVLGLTVLAVALIMRDEPGRPTINPTSIVGMSLSLGGATLIRVVLPTLRTLANERV